MGQDIYGNYIADLQPGPALAGSRGALRYGTGAPSNTFGNVGDGYVNTANGDFYSRRTIGWELQSGGGGGGSIEQVIAFTAADPNVASLTPDDPTKGAIYTQDGADLTVLWRWDVAAQTWRQITG